MKSFFLCLWMAQRWLARGKGPLLSQSAGISFVGLILGVGALVVSMAVISGFETTLKRNVSETTGHLNVYAKRVNTEPTSTFSFENLFGDLENRLYKMDSRIQTLTPYLLLDAILAHKGHLGGVFIQGLDASRASQVLALRDRLIKGRFLLGAEISLKQNESQKREDSLPWVLIGKVMAQDFHIQVGDQINIILPIMNDLDPAQFRRRLGKFRVGGILDLGKYEYDQRMIVADIQSAQDLAQLKNKFSGYILKLKNVDQAREVGQNLRDQLGPQFRVKDWREVNENLFDAIQIEKLGIFFVIFIILIAASFHVASSLYISVVQRYSDIAILKTLGLSEKNIRRIFQWQGILLGGVGSLGGILLGALLCVLVTHIEKKWGLIPGSVYKIDRIDLQIRLWDILAIITATLGICLVASMAPARRGARMNPVEGIRNV